VQPNADIKTTVKTAQETKWRRDDGLICGMAKRLAQKICPQCIGVSFFLAGIGKRQTGKRRLCISGNLYGKNI
jgi:hypothetical protein